MPVLGTGFSFPFFLDYPTGTTNMKTIETMQKTQTGQPAASTIAPIAIGRLAISPLNVRKKAPGGIAELADLIKSQGLIHNLVVTEQQKKKKKTGNYEVVAGGRRLAALELLVAEGRLSAADEVNCRIVSMDEALEMSLAENSGREAMHPADLVMAYRNLTEAGLAPDEIAPRFGVSPLTVKRYLKLTHVSPALFALYADDQMNFEQISALALTDDHDLQQRLWNDTSEWQRNGTHFRRLITGAEIDITRHPLAKFVGVEAYEAEGGLIRRDLFKDADEGYMQDAELLESLALEKLNQSVESVKGEGFAWVEVHTTFDYSDEANFGRMRSESRQPTDVEQEQIDALEAERSAIEADFESYDEDTDETGEVYAAIEAKANGIEAKLDALLGSLAEPHPDDRALAGAVVTVDSSGQLRIKRGLIRKEDMKKQPSGRIGASGSVKADEPKAVHSEKLTRMLTAHRTAALQAAMADRPDVALAALVHSLAEKVLANGYGASPVKINLQRIYLKPDADNIEQSKAAIALADKHQYWKDRAETREEGQDLFTWLLEQPQQDLLDLLALCVAYSIDTVTSREHAPSQPVAKLMNALNLNMAQWWEATAENYLAHVNKDRILSIVTDAVSPRNADLMRGLKKADLVRQAESELSGLNWLPDNFKCEAQSD
jgi:ParB family chromosome partitioning protein